MSEPLQVVELRAGYGELTILEGITLTVEEGEVVTLLGRNGSGKSTLLKSIVGLARVFSGRVLLGKKDLTRLPTHERILQGIGYVPQLRNVFPTLTVRENLEVVASFEEDLERSLEELTPLFPPLSTKANERVERLSGGERQMVAIARALVGSPRFLLLDEPTAGLSPVLARALLGKIREIARGGRGVLLVEQNAQGALEVSDRAWVLSGGRIAHEGRGREILSSPDLRRIFLGET